VAKTFKLANGKTATIMMDWGNGVVQFSYTNSEGTIKVVRGKLADWQDLHSAGRTRCGNDISGI